MAATEIVRLPSACWIWLGPLAHRHAGDLLERHHPVGAADGDRQALDVAGVDPVVRVQAHRDVTRLAARVDPVAGLDTGEGHAQRLRRVGHRDAQGIGQAAVELDLHLGLRVLLRQADVHRTRHLAQLVHEALRDVEQHARVGAGEADLHRLLRTVVQVVEHHVLGADQACGERAQLGRDLFGTAPAFGALADVDIDAAAARVDVAVGRLGLGQRARQRRGGLDLQPRVVQAAARRRAHLDGQGAAVGRRQEARAAELRLQRHGGRQARHREDGHPAPMVQRPGDEPAVAVGLVVEPGVEALQQRTDAALGRVVVARRVAPVGRQHRVEREADEQADQHRGDHGQPEGPEPFARDAGHEGHRDEHRDDREGGGRHRQADLGACPAAPR